MWQGGGMVLQSLDEVGVFTGCLDGMGLAKFDKLVSLERM
jgi:hypothetical protein